MSRADNGSEIPGFEPATHPKFNSLPLINGWLEDKPFLLGFDNFSGASC